MRFLSLLSTCENLPDQNSTDNNSSNIEKENSPYLCYDKILYKKYKIMTTMYRNDNFFRDNYRRIVNMVHPFEKINTTITSNFIKGEAPIKITNAYMKLWEFIKWIDSTSDFLKNIPDKSLRVFDIAGAPGMFILSLEQYLLKYYPQYKLDWFACSLEGGTALKDTYKLYKQNPSRYFPCDVSSENDLKNIIEKFKRNNSKDLEEENKFPLVLGDIGIFHENDYEKLQEENQLKIQWGQMVLGLNLSKIGGIMFLKMYSLTSYQALYLLDTLTQYFNKVYISKPYTSRIFNDESYIICIGRNFKKCSSVSLTLPNIKEYFSPNFELVRSFEYSRQDIKFKMAEVIKNILFKKLYNNREKQPQNKNQPQNIYAYAYDIYFKELEELLKELGFKF